jgi:ABC-type branched-subunit amino acid transport system substrate-binding protein
LFRNKDLWVFPNRIFACIRAAVVLATAVFLFLGGVCLADPINKLKIGVVLPLSGPFHLSGETIKNSIGLAEDKFDVDNKIEFIFEDDQLEPKNTVTAVRKLMEQDKVRGLIIFGSPSGLAVSEIAEKSKIPFVVFSMLDKIVIGKKYVMEHWLTADAINQMIVAEVKRKELRTVSLVTLSNDAMLKLRSNFIASSVTKIITDSEYPKSESDFRAEVLKIRSKNPAAVYVLLWAPQLSIFAKQLRESGYKGIIFGTQNFEDRNEIANSNNALEGSWFVATDDSNAKEYYELYKSKFNSIPVAGGANAYDLAKIFMDCSQASDLNACLHGVKNFSGVLGTYSATENNDFSLSPALRCIRNGVIVGDNC